MKVILSTFLCFFLLAFGLRVLSSGPVVPNEILQPGTQPETVTTFDTPDKCEGCHSNYDTTLEPAHNWRGSMMAHASRDPIFWAAMAVAEQDFAGSGDLCLRCHTPNGWLAGRSSPTDGSVLTAADADGVTCDSCHKLTTPDDSEFVGAQFAPFLAHDASTPARGYYGSGMYSIWPGIDKHGPYSNPLVFHPFKRSTFQRRPEFCGTCHDVSNPAVGDLAPNHGAQPTADPVIASGVLGSPIAGKAAFNNFPFQYGIVERTFSEHMASVFPTTLVSAYASLPAPLRAGAIKRAYEGAIAAGTGGNYEDGTNRYFTCQTCHLPPVTGKGSSLNSPVRKDLPRHDLTGGNYWVPDVILYQESKGQLRLGGGMKPTQRAALLDGKARAMAQLGLAASLTTTGNTVRVVNLTGHKLISGYPEGRRMWLNVKWYDAQGTLLREDGKYGSMDVQIGGATRQVKTLIDLGGANTRVYESHHAITQDWAAKLIGLGYDPGLALGYDRVTGAVTATLGQLAARPAGTYEESFHFVLNNHVASDTRIPPYGMRYDEARKRNTLPVPATQYGNPGQGGTFDYWDDVALNPPAGASYASVGLMYQPTSWEYIQFLSLANTRQNAFLANEGANLLDAWLNTGMAEPYLMASTTWGADADADGMADVWEGQAGLDPAVADAGTDADGDGLTNLQEYQRGTHPRGFATRYLAEGASSTFFDASYAVLNTSATTEARVLIRHVLNDGTMPSQFVTVPPLARRTVSAQQHPGLAGGAFSTIVESDQVVVVDRTMAWDARGYGAHAETGAITPSTTWFTAEGATHSGFQLFYMLDNPNAQPAVVSVAYLVSAGPSPAPKAYVIPANGRLTIWVNDEARLTPILAATDVAARVTSDRPIVVERAMYRDAGDQIFGAGQASAAVTSTSLHWMFAEGATGSYFDEFLLVANPNPGASQITVRYLLDSGVVITRQYTVAGLSRFNVWVDQEDPALASAAHATTVTVTNGVPIVVERSMWWPGPTAATWQEAHLSAGVTQSAAKWALADGEQGGARDVQTYILVANAEATTATVQATLLFEDGTSAAQTFVVGPTSRFNVDVGAHFPEANGRRFAAIVQSLGATPTPIVVERSMYWNASGVVWAAGTNVAATRLP